MSSARPGKVALGIGSALKVNIIEQAFTWYPIRGSITNTAGNIQVLNSSDFIETPSISSICPFALVTVVAHVLVCFKTNKVKFIYSAPTFKYVNQA